jgi:hypothetical protein
VLYEAAVTFALTGRLHRQGEVWRELGAVIQAKPRLCAVEWKQIVLVREIVSVEPALMFVTAFLTAAFTHMDLGQGKLRDSGGSAGRCAIHRQAGE